MPLFPKVHTLCVPVSFETGEQATHKIPFGSRVEILSVRSEVSKALAGTDAGTIAIKNHAGTTTHATLSHAASAALGDQQVTSFASPVRVVVNQDLLLTSAKTTAGGKALCFIRYVHLPPA